VAVEGLSPDVLREPIRSGRLVASEATTALHTLIQGLRPPVLDDLGLVPAVRQLVDQVEQHGRPTVALKVNGLQARLPTDLELTAYRIIQGVPEQRPVPRRPRHQRRVKRLGGTLNVRSRPGRGTTIPRHAPVVTRPRRRRRRRAACA
jgi:signal transduction histidine kinase